MSCSRSIVLRFPLRLYFIFLTAIFVVTSGAAAIGDTFSWIGGGGSTDGNWSSTANWLDGATPLSNSSSIVRFQGLTTGATTLNQNLLAPLVLNQLLFVRDNSANGELSAYTLGGGDLLFAGAGAMLSANGTSTSAGGVRYQTVNNNIIIGGSELTFYANDTRTFNNLTINGNITTTAAATTLYLNGSSTNSVIAGTITEAEGQSISLVKRGAGYWFLGNQGNQWHGGATVEAGRLVIGGTAALGTVATLTFGAATTSGHLVFDEAADGSIQTVSQHMILTGVGGGVMSETSGANSFTVRINGTIENIGTEPIYVFSLGGTSTNINQLNSTLTDGNIAGSKLALTKTGTGTWEVTGSNAFSGGVSINGGALRVASVTNQLNFGANAITFGNLTSPTYLETSGSFDAKLGTGPSQVNIRGSLGFSASSGGPLEVILRAGDGSIASLDFGERASPVTASNSIGYVHRLSLNSMSGENVVTFNNPVNFLRNAATPTNSYVYVYDNPSSSLDRAIMTGVVSGSGLFYKMGDGHLRLEGDNTFSGGYTLTDGTLSGDLDVGLNISANNVMFAGASSANSVIESKGVWSPKLGAGSGEVQWSPNTTGSATPTTGGSGGFSAFDGPLDVTLKIVGDEVTAPTLVWGVTPYFAANAATVHGELHFGSMFSDDVTTFYNPLNLGAAVSRTIRVYDNPATNDDYTVIKGLISSTSTTASTMILTKSGEGKLVLTADNTFTGLLSINRGTVVLGTGGNTGSVAGAISVTSSSAGLALLVINRSDMLTIDKVIGGNSRGMLEVAGGINGGLVLAAAATYSGTTTITQGTLRFTVDNALSSSGKLAVNNTGTVDLNGYALSITTLTDAAAGVGGIITNNRAAVGNSSVLTVVGNGYFSGTIADGASNAVALVKSGAATTLTLAHANSYSGGTTILSGTLVMGNIAALGTGSLRLNGGGLDAGSFSPIFTATVLLGGSSSLGGAGDITFTGSGNAVTAASTVTLNQSGMLTINGLDMSTASAPLAFTGPGGVTLTGMTQIGQALSLTLNNNGTRVINSMLLAADLTLNGSAGAVAINGVIGLTGGGGAGRTLTVNNSGGATLLGGINLAADSVAHSLTLRAVTGLTVGGPVTGGGAITLLSGTLTLTGASNNYSGGTTITGGTLAMGHAAALGSGTLRINGGGLDVGAVAPVVAAPVIIGGSFALSGASDVTFTGAGNAVTAASVITLNQSGLLTVNNLDMSTAAANLTFAGTGGVTLTGQTTIGQALTLTLNNGGTRIINSMLLAADLTLNGTAGAVAINGVIGLTGGSGAGRTLTVNNAGGATLLGGINLAADSVAHSLTLRAVTGLTVGGPVTGGGGVTLQSGSLTFTGATNNYTGGTTINAGALRVANYAAGLAASALRFNTAAITQGVLETSGSLTNNVTASTSVGANQMTWLLSGGFAARGGNLTVKLNNNDTTPLDWDLGGFVPVSNELQFGSTTADGVVTFLNPLNFGAVTRTIRVFDNTATTDDYVVMKGIVSGAVGLSKMGPGKLVLEGGASYTGQTTSSGGGILQIGNGNAAPFSGNVLYIGGDSTIIVDRTVDTLFTTLTPFSSQTGYLIKNQTTAMSMTSLSGGNVHVTINGGSFSLGRGGAMTYSGNLASVTMTDNTRFIVTTSTSITMKTNVFGSGEAFVNPVPLGSTAANTITLIGDFTNTGGTIFGGTVTTNATTKNPTVSIGDGTTTGSGSVAGNITLSGANVILAFNRPDDYAYAGNLTGAGFQVRKLTNSTLTLSGTSDYSAPTSIAAGTVVVTGAIGGAGGGTVAAGATLRGINGTAAGAWTINGNLELGSVGAVTTFTLGSLIINGGTLNFDLGSTSNADRIVLTSGVLPTIGADLNLTFNKLSGFNAGTYTLISGYGSQSMSSTDFARLLYSNTLGIYTLTLHNTPGALTLEVTGGGPQNLSWAGGTGAWDTTAANWTGGASYLDGDLTTFGNIAGTTTVSVDAGGVAPGSVAVNNDASHPYAFAGGPITGATGLLKQGVGTLTLSGNQTFTGGVTIAGGTLQVAGTMAAATIDVQGEILQFNTAATQTINALISGTGTLQKLGGGTTALTAINTFVGTTSIDAGTLLVDHALGGTIYVNSGGAFVGAGAADSTVVFAGGSGTVSSTQTGTTTVSSGTVAVDDGGTLAGLVTVAGGTLNVQNGGTITGSINLVSGTIALMSGGSASSTPGITVGAGGTFNVSGGSVTGNGQIGVSGSFIANGTVGDGDASLVVHNGGTLSGSGAVLGTIIVETGGGLSPGNSVESLTAGNLTLSSGGNLYFEFRNAEGMVPGLDWDLIDLGTSGILDLGDATAVTPISLHIDSWRLDNTDHGGGLGDDFNGFDPQSNYEWLFIQVNDLSKLAMVPNGDDFSRRFHIYDAEVGAGVFDASASNPFDRPGSSLGQGTFSVAWRDGPDGYGLYVQYSAIPEPGTVTLTALAAAGLAYARRRKKSKSSVP